MFERPDYIADEPLYVVTAVFNSPRYRTRWKLYEDFAKRVREAGAYLTTIECAFGDRDAVLLDEPNTIHVRTSHELWLKENLLNLAVQRLPMDWKYVAWIDADVSFARDDWANETIHKLQHFPVLQMFSHALDLDPESRPHGGIRPCFIADPRADFTNDYYDFVKRGASGLAWACRRDFWDASGGLMDYGVLGASDWYMAHALFNQLTEALVRQYTPAHRDLMLEWQARVQRFFNIRGDQPGFVPGLVLHYWHGHKNLRGYKTREQILVDHQFDPNLDLKRDWQGLWQLTGRVPALRSDIRAYLHSRNEDSLEV